MASAAARDAAEARFPDNKVATAALRNAFRETYADGFDAGAAQARSDAAWDRDYDRQGGI